MTRALLFALLIATFSISSAVAQSREGLRSPILVIDSEKLFTDSEFGQSVARDVAKQGADLTSENRRIEGELAEEEKSLTALRASTAPVDFRALADAFDEKVLATRERQVNKTQALSRQLEEQRIVFLEAASPVLERLMREAGAVVLLERSTVVFSANAVDVTERAIQQLNLELGAKP